MIEPYYTIEELLYKIKYAIFWIREAHLEAVDVDRERIRDLLSGAEACVRQLKRELIKEGITDA